MGADAIRGSINLVYLINSNTSIILENGSQCDVRKRSHHNFTGDVLSNE